MKKVLLILKWYEEPQNAPSLLYHYQTNHYCFLSQAKLFCVQDLMGRAIYFGYNHDHKSSVQRNNNNKGEKSYFYKPDSSEQLPYCYKPILKNNLI